MSDGSFFDVALHQRACRDFTDEPVPDADLERMLVAATHAPSAENTQPWVFVVVRDVEQRAAIASIARRLWTSTARSYSAPHLDAAMLAELDASIDEGFGGAPVLVVIGADLRSGVHPNTLPSSIFPAVQNLLLAANALGYGSALTTLTTVVVDELRGALALPAEIVPMAVVPIGRSARALGKPRRDPIATKTHRDRFGVAW